MSVCAFDEAFEKVEQLVATFRANEKTYLDSSYTEARARKDFIDKFFMALGWDVNHDIQTNPSAQEVSVEPAEGTSKRRADYAFRIAPDFRKTRFFVEAKKPHGDIATADNYFQTIRYGWPNRTPLAVLTDFREFHVLDSRYEPNINTALERWVKRFKYTDYTDRNKFAEIYWLFSREAVAAGELEKFAAALPKGRGKKGLPAELKDIDDSFLEKLDGYRDTLTHAFKNRNPRLDSETLTEITQRTLDRLVFLRFLEDKLIEPRRLVAGFGKKNSAWQDFIAASRRLDGIYNGIVYKSHDLLDSSTFRVDDQVFAAICHSLSDTYSPYDFNSIPIHILGSIYERFLGKVVVATDKRVRVTEKPEVRKAGGVYYTPEYIVRDIIENTVGKLIAGKTPDQIAEMHFADIACGSGSFLLGMYDLLLAHHGTYYNENPGKVRRGDCIERDGQFHLSLRKKREILVNNIYGVDIDAQAVEVCQLSLYLKLLEDETTASARDHQLEFHETLLPPLNKNIVCGNSLVGTDILDGQLFPSDEERELNPMNFEDAFPHIFGQPPATVRESESEYRIARSIGQEGGRRVYPPPPVKTRGFDAIVGNPPWGASFGEIELAYFRNKYQSVIARMVDSYIYFLDRALQLVPEHGLVGYIIPSTLLNQVDAKPARRLLLSHGLSSLVSLGAGVFGSKVLNTSTIVITGKRDDGLLVLDDLSHFQPSERDKTLEASNTTCWKDWSGIVERDSHLTFFVNKQDASALLIRLREMHPLLGSLIPGGIQRGVSPDIAEAHVVTKAMEKRLKLEAELLRPSVSGPQIKRYQDWKSDQFIIYTTRDTVITKHRHIAKYMERFHAQNSCPEVRQGKHPWWALHRPRDPQIFTSPKIIGLTTTKTIELIYDPKESVFVTDAMYVFHPPENWDAWTLMAIMQSKVFLFLYRTANQGESRVIPQVKATKLETLPVPACDASHRQSQRLLELSDQMFAAKNRFAKARTDKDKTYYERRCTDLDRQIDDIVYELYSLTDDEVRIVEGNNV